MREVMGVGDRAEGNSLLTLTDLTRRGTASRPESRPLSGCQHFVGFLLLLDH